MQRNSRLSHFFYFILYLHCLFYLVSDANAVSLGQRNATWSRSIFFRGVDPSTHEILNDQTLVTFASQLKKNGIRYAYIFSGPFQKDGHLPRYAFSEQARRSIKRLKEIYPDLKILPWIGGIEGKTVFLENETWVKRSIQETINLVKSLPVDGIHIDLEYVLYPTSNSSKGNLEDYNKNWALFHKLLREAMPNTFLSTVVVSTAEGTKPWKYKHAMSDIAKASNWVDQVVFMFYETSLQDPDAYRSAIHSQLLQIKQMKTMAMARSPEYLMGIGTFKSQKHLEKFRNMALENTSNTLSMIRALSIELSPKFPLLDGISIYCEWLTSSDDWKSIRTNWTEDKTQ